jgi:hypothetical protein
MGQQPPPDPRALWVGKLRVGSGHRRALFDFPGVTSEQDDEVCRKLNNGRLLTALSGWPEPASSRTPPARRPDGGWRIVDGWESQEALERFGQRLLPLLEQAGFLPAEPPQVFSVTTSSPNSPAGGLGASASLPDGTARAPGLVGGMPGL